MTEADAESMWDVLFESTRFAKANVRIGSLINFWITQAAGTDIVDADITPILAQLSEEILLDLYIAAKAHKLVDPWDFVQAHISSVTISHLKENRELLQMIRDKIYGTMELVERNLPDANDRTYGDVSNLYPD